ncbi:hypothetical protein RRG08_010915 [Elysia crispata]|uniref:Uncharacterized protein n=1 Tax=Elysia crispata TaxID=231223 RepID=A0AAE1DR43_9GAST|nr:hypothetical protein RRG08_010915 [Elysia crispata]
MSYEPHVFLSTLPEGGLSDTYFITNLVKLEGKTRYTSPT